MIFLSFFALPLLLFIGGYIWFGRKISLQELALQIVIQALFVGTICAIIYHKNTYDEETWNGRVASKSRDIVSCSHAYPCNCRMESCGKDCTTLHCDTCYMHSYDVVWIVRTSNNEGVEISRIDLQGLGEPPRWAAVKIGEPTSISHSYENYIKASPDTLFRSQGDTKESMPGYPNGYYDYYRLDHLVQFGVSVPDAADWNRELAELNADLGKSKQVNIIIALVGGKERRWFKTLERHWIGGKKNDAVLVIGVDKDGTISWAETMAWTDHAYFKVKLRDDIREIGKLDRTAILAAIRSDVSGHFKHKSMDDFKYLMASITPTTTEYVVGLVLSIIISVLLIWWCEEKDVFGDEDEEFNWFQRLCGKGKSKKEMEDEKWEHWGRL